MQLVSQTFERALDTYLTGNSDIPSEDKLRGLARICRRYESRLHDLYKSHIFVRALEPLPDTLERTLLARSQPLSSMIEKASASESARLVNLLACSIFIGSSSNPFWPAITSEAKDRVHSVSIETVNEFPDILTGLAKICLPSINELDSVHQSTIQDLSARPLRYLTEEDLTRRLSYLQDMIEDSSFWAVPEEMNSHFRLFVIQFVASQVFEFNRYSSEQQQSFLEERSQASASKAANHKEMEQKRLNPPPSLPQTHPQDTSSLYQHQERFRTEQRKPAIFQGCVSDVAWTNSPFSQNVELAKLFKTHKNRHILRTLITDRGILFTDLSALSPSDIRYILDHPLIISSPLFNRSEFKDLTTFDQKTRSRILPMACDVLKPPSIG